MRTVSLRSIASSSNGALLRKLRIWWMISTARISSRLISARISLTSLTSGDGEFNISSAVSVLVKMAAERLIQLVRDRGSQFPRCRLTVRMRQLGQAIAGLALRVGSPVPFVQQDRNQHGLYQQHGGNGKGLPAVFLPYTRLAKTNFAAGRQIKLADPPSLHLQPIEDRLHRLRRGYGNTRRRFAVQNPHRQVCGVSANQTGNDHRAADAPRATSGSAATMIGGFAFSATSSNPLAGEK